MIKIDGMKKLKFFLASFLDALLTVPPVFAQDPFVYPDKG
jgi:hypothetical protein